MSFSKLDGPPPTKQESTFHVGSLVLPLASVLPETLSTTISPHLTKGGLAREAEGSEQGPCLFNSHTAKQETPRAQNHHCAAQHPQISLI